MPYTVNKTNGTILTDVLDNSVDRITTDLTLIGKNTSNYGEYFNENFVRLLENFANSEPPRAPLRGQIWFDTSENRIKYYDGSTFKELARPVVSSAEPSLTAGDFWINNSKRQLYFNDGTGNRLAGPIYTAQQGVSGHEVSTIVDTNGINHVIVKLKIGSKLVGCFTKASFTPNYTNIEGKLLEAEGMSGPLIAGFNPASLGVDGNNIPIIFKFNTTVKNAENLVDAFGQPVNVNDFVRTVGLGNINGRLSITGNNPNNPIEPTAIPLTLGYASNTSFEIAQLIVGDPTIPPVKLKNNVTDQDLTLVVKSSAGFKESIYVDASSSHVGVWNTDPVAPLDVSGNLNVRGNIVTNSSTIGIVNTVASSVNIAGAATAVNIGSSLGTTNVKNNLEVDYDLKINGGDLTSGTATFNLVNTGTNTINFGGSATNITIGDPLGTVTFRNNVTANGIVTLSGKLAIDNLLLEDSTIKANSTLTDLNLTALDGKINLKVEAVADENFTLKKRLIFDDIGVNSGIIGVVSGFNNEFSLLDQNVATINFGGQSTAINVGGTLGTTTIRHNFNLKGNMTIGPLEPQEINSNELTVGQSYRIVSLGNVTRGQWNQMSGITDPNNYIDYKRDDIFVAFTTGTGDGRVVPHVEANYNSNCNFVRIFANSAKTINIGDSADTVNILYEKQLPGQANPNFGKRLNIYAESTFLEGDLVIQGGDISAPSDTTIATIFNGIQGRITIGSATGIIELGGASTLTKIGGNLKVGSVQGELEIISRALSGGVFNGELNASANTQSFDLLPENVLNLRVASQADKIFLGKNTILEDAIVPGSNVDLNGNPQTPTFILYQPIPAQLPITIARKHFLVRDKLIVPNLDTAGGGGAGILYKNEKNEIDASVYMRMNGNTLVVLGDLQVASRLLSSSDSVNGVWVPKARIGRIKVEEALVSDLTTIPMFVDNVETINLGGTSLTRVEMGSTNTVVNFPGSIREKWITVSSLRNAQAGDNLLIDNTSTNVQIYLPTNPEIGDRIKFIDKTGVNATRQLFIYRNGKKINGADADINIQTPGRAFTLVYTGATRGWCYDNA